MAVAYDATGGGSAVGSANPVNISWSHTCTGSDRGVLVAVAYGDNGAGSPTDYTRTCSYGATPMTLASTQASNNSTTGWVELWKLEDPPTGATTVTASAAKTVGGDHPWSAVGCSVSFTGMDTFATAVTPVYSLGTSQAITIPSATNNYTLAAMCCGNNITAITHDQRYLGNTGDATSAGNLVMGTYPGAASVVFTGSVAASDAWGAVGVSINAVTAGNTSSVYVRGTSSWAQSIGSKIWDGNSWVETQDPGLT